MGLTPQQKANKDRARAQKSMGKNPNILAQMLSQAFNDQGKRTKQGILGVVQGLDRKKSWSGTSLLKVLVGQGYLRPEGGGGYSMTHKGAALRQNYLRQSAGPAAHDPRPAENPGTQSARTPDAAPGDA